MKARFDVERIAHSLASAMVAVPEGLNRDELLRFILSTAAERADQLDKKPKNQYTITSPVALSDWKQQVLWAIYNNARNNPRHHEEVRRLLDMLKEI